MMDNYFTELNAVNVNDRTETKNGLTYLSWAYAWGELKKRYPDSTYTVYENKDGWNYHTDGKTAWVKTGVTVNGIEHIEMLPVMDFRNNSIPLDKVTSYDVNKAIQRSLTKAVARHGLGLYIYAGEDLPDGEEPKDEPKEEPREDRQPRIACVRCGAYIRALRRIDGTVLSPFDIANSTKAKFGEILCLSCARDAEKENDADR
jgi:hypothetical protein